MRERGGRRASGFGGDRGLRDAVGEGARRAVARHSGSVAVHVALIVLWLLGGGAESDVHDQRGSIVRRLPSEGPGPARKPGRPRARAPAEPRQRRGLMPSPRRSPRRPRRHAARLSKATAPPSRNDQPAPRLSQRRPPPPGSQAAKTSRAPAGPARAPPEPVRDDPQRCGQARAKLRSRPRPGKGPLLNHPRRAPGRRHPVAPRGARRTPPEHPDAAGSGAEARPAPGSPKEVRRLGCAPHARTRRAGATARSGHGAAAHAGTRVRRESPGPRVGAGGRGEAGLASRGSDPDRLSRPPSKATISIASVG